MLRTGPTGAEPGQVLPETAGRGTIGRRSAIETHSRSRCADVHLVAPEACRHNVRSLSPSGSFLASVGAQGSPREGPTEVACMNFYLNDQESAARHGRTTLATFRAVSRRTDPEAVGPGLSPEESDAIRLGTSLASSSAFLGGH
jgi:hypothetical protein